MKQNHVFFFRASLVFALGAVLFYFIYPYAVALLTGTIFAMVLLPLYRRWRHKTRHERLLAAAITFGFALAFLAPLGLSLYAGANKGIQQIQSLQNKQDPGAALVKGDAGTAIDRWMKQNPDSEKILKKLPVSEEKVRIWADRAMSGMSEGLTQLVQNILKSLPSMIFTSLIILVTIYFVLSDGEKASGFMEHNPMLSPLRTREVLNTFQDASYSIVVASVISGLCQASVLVSASIILGKGSPILIGLITFFCSFLPLIGTTPVSVLLVVSQLLGGDTSSAMVFAGFGFVASIADNLVIPFIVGEHTKIHPLIVFVSAFGAIEMIGVYGLFVGPVVAATFMKVLTIMGTIELKDHVEKNIPDFDGSLSGPRSLRADVDFHSKSLV